MGLRHGGNTEGGDADLTDTQIRALSGHKTAAMTALYTKAAIAGAVPGHVSGLKQNERREFVEMSR